MRKKLFIFPKHFDHAVRLISVSSAKGAERMDIATLYPKYFDDLTRYARYLTRNASSAEDIAQETFLRALKNIHLLSDMKESQIRSWLYTTARNVVIDQARRAKRAPALAEAGYYTDDLSAVLVENLMQALSSEDQHLVNLRYFVGMNSTEIGELLSLPAATVRTRLRAASKRLRIAYDDR